MAEKSNLALQEIVDNKENYQEGAYLAAVEELKNRGLATGVVMPEKPEIIESAPENQQPVEDEEGESVFGRRRNLKESLALFIPSEGYLFTPIIVYLNVFVFILMLISGVDPMLPTVESLLVWGGNLREFTVGGQPWRLLTNIFLHGGLLHLLFNMYALVNIGELLEPQVGKGRYLFVYIATGIIASISSISFHENIVSVGASGAIFGLYGLFLALLILKVLDIPRVSRNNLIISILFFIGFNLIYGFSKEGIDNSAHIGGLLSGIIIGFAYYPTFSKPKYSNFISIGITVIIFAFVLVLPKMIVSKVGEFQTAMEEFSINEEKALWMYREDLSYIPEEKIQVYYDKLEDEGIALWQENIDLLASLTDLPPYLLERVEMLNKYCDLRIQSCEILQGLLKNDQSSDWDKLQTINIAIEKIITDMQKLNE